MCIPPCDYNRLVLQLALVLQELRTGCATLGFDVSDDLVIQIFDASDLDGNRVVDFREFIVVLAILYMFSTEVSNALPKML